MHSRQITKQSKRQSLERVWHMHGEGNGTPLQYSCLENPMNRGAWKAAVHGVAEGRTRLSDFTFTFHFSLSRIGEGNGNPRQCSCLENLRDGGAWWAAIYGVAKSQTRLKRLSSSSMACAGNHEKFRETETPKVQGKISEYEFGELLWEGNIIKYSECQTDFFSYKQKKLKISLHNRKYF